MADAPLQDRVAVVTGGARGIGLAIARTLHEAGARVALVDSGCGIDGGSPDDGVVRAAADGFGERALGVAADVSDPDAVQAAVDGILNWAGRIDILVNNAAILRDGFVFKAAPADYARVIAVNLTGAFLMTNAVTPVLRAQAKLTPDQTWGRVVNIVSTAGLYGNYGQAAYASAKAGLVGLTRVTALDMSRSGVTCNAVAPFAATRVTDTIVPQNEAQAAYKERAMSVPAERVGSLVGLLAGDAGREVTGQIFGVRAREVFLFSQARPAATAVLGEGDVLADLAASFTPLETDLESFSGDPLL